MSEPVITACLSPSWADGRADLELVTSSAFIARDPHLQPPLESQVHVQWREERPDFFSARKVGVNCQLRKIPCQLPAAGRSPGIGFDSVRSVMAWSGEVFLRGFLHVGFARFGSFFVGSFLKPSKVWDCLRSSWLGVLFQNIYLLKHSISEMLEHRRLQEPYWPRRRRVWRQAKNAHNSLVANGAPRLCKTGFTDCSLIQLLCENSGL